MAFRLPQGHSHESIDALHRAHNNDADSDVRSHRDDNSASRMCPTSSARQIQMIVHLADRTQRASVHSNL
jgi:hypothetical protein